MRCCSTKANGAQSNTRERGNDHNVLPVWEKGLTGKGVVVTIVDDGMEHDHPDLKDNYDSKVGFVAGLHDSATN